jgi:hypothetical protein
MVGPSAKQIDYWDFEEDDDEVWTILRHEGTPLWRELAFWKGYERFAQVFGVLEPLCQVFGVL